MGAEESTSDRSLRPLLIIASGAVCITAAVTILPLSNLLKEYLELGVRTLQLICGVTYAVGIAKYSLDSGVLQKYVYAGTASKIFGELAGPWASLVTELTEILSFSQLALALFMGVSLNGWNHDLSFVDYWLVTISAGILLALSLFYLASRILNLVRYWEDTSTMLD